MKIEQFFFLQSTVILSLMTWGIFVRKNRKLHPRIMLFSIAWDIILILQIELNQGAIKQTIEYTKNALLLNIHIAIAVSTVLAYFIVLFTGVKLLKGNNSLRKKHKLIGITTYTLRILTYLTSFLVMDL